MPKCFADEKILITIFLQNKYALNCRKKFQIGNWPNKCGANLYNSNKASGIYSQNRFSLGTNIPLETYIQSPHSHIRLY